VAPSEAAALLYEHPCPRRSLPVGSCRASMSAGLSGSPWPAVRRAATSGDTRFASSNTTDPTANVCLPTQGLFRLRQSSLSQLRRHFRCSHADQRQPTIHGFSLNESHAAGCRLEVSGLSGIRGGSGVACRPRSAGMWRGGPADDPSDGNNRLPWSDRQLMVVAAGRKSEGALRFLFLRHLATASRDRATAATLATPDCHQPKVDPTSSAHRRLSPLQPYRTDHPSSIGAMAEMTAENASTK
jgi:hypothetical protein